MDLNDASMKLSETITELEFVEAPARAEIRAALPQRLLTRSLSRFLVLLLAGTGLFWAGRMLTFIVNFLRAQF